MKLGRVLGTSLVFLGAVLFVGQAFALPEWDTPTVQQIGAKASTVRLAVQAGATGAGGGFSVEWMLRSQYDANGGWPAAGDSRIMKGNFTGVPVWVVQGDAGDYTLPPQEWQAVELGELFDESGVLAISTDELLPSTEYAVRVTALADPTWSASPPSATLFVTTSATIQNCTFTQGYWKNHPAAWPVTSLTIGGHLYSAAELLSILNTPAGGNGLLILAHQVIAAELNIAQGADGSAIAADLATADALMSGLVIPPVGTDSLAPSAVNALATNLDNYNNGLIGPGHCADTPTHPTTWGSVKATYRN